MKLDKSIAGVTARLTIGWRDIGAAVGSNAKTLTQAHSQGRLPVQPMKLGHIVAMTPDQIRSLEAALCDERLRRRPPIGAALKATLCKEPS